MPAVAHRCHELQQQHHPPLRHAGLHAPVPAVEAAERVLGVAQGASPHGAGPPRRVVPPELGDGEQVDPARAWEKQVLSARGFKRVGRHSECAI